VDRRIIPTVLDRKSTEGLSAAIGKSYLSRFLARSKSLSGSQPYSVHAGKFRNNAEKVPMMDRSPCWCLPVLL